MSNILSQNFIIPSILYIIFINGNYIISNEQTSVNDFIKNQTVPPKTRLQITIIGDIISDLYNKQETIPIVFFAFIRHKTKAAIFKTSPIP